MSKYVAFLRAINVGGTTLIKMTDLKKMFESFGLQNVQTYIQTGNVIFESDERSAPVLEARIEDQLEKLVGKRIRLFVRTMRDVVAMADECPYQPNESEIAYVAILQKKPDKKNEQALKALCSDADDFVVKGREAYALRRDRETSVFSNQLIEKTLGVAGTTRNLNTIKKLAEKYR